MIKDRNTSNNWMPAATAGVSTLSAADVLVFVCLELLASMAILGNGALIVVIVRYKYLNKASFVLMFSLAIADILHGTVTSSYFYPPIVLKFNHMPLLGIRIFNVIDWTAWSITITHMSAICIDRIIAILLFARYLTIVTPRRVRIFSALCWLLFFSANLYFYLANYCCLIVPQARADFYSFDYNKNLNTVNQKLTIDNNNNNQRNSLINQTQASIIMINQTFLKTLIKNNNNNNIYPIIYVPLEVLTLIILAVTNPITLIKLWQRHKRKTALRNASQMLLEMSQTMTLNRMGAGCFEDASKSRETANKRASRQQTRVFVQITAVAVIFFSYMFVYYLFFYVVEVGAKWAVLFNSFFYSTTHMINPVIYFGLNDEMRDQLIETFNWLCCFCCYNCPNRLSSRKNQDKQTRKWAKNKNKNNKNNNNNNYPKYGFKRLFKRDFGREGLLISNENCSCSMTARKSTTISTSEVESADNVDNLKSSNRTPGGSIVSTSVAGKCPSCHKFSFHQLNSKKGKMMTMRRFFVSLEDDSSVSTNNSTWTNLLSSFDTPKRSLSSTAATPSRKVTILKNQNTSTISIIPELSTDANLTNCDDIANTSTSDRFDSTNNDYTDVNLNKFVGFSERNYQKNTYKTIMNYGSFEHNDSVERAIHFGPNNSTNGWTINNNNNNNNNNTLASVEKEDQEDKNKDKNVIIQGSTEGNESVVPGVLIEEIDQQPKSKMSAKPKEQQLRVIDKINTDKNINILSKTISSQELNSDKNNRCEKNDENYSEKRPSLHSLGVGLTKRTNFFTLTPSTTGNFTENLGTYSDLDLRSVGTDMMDNEEF